MDSWRVRCETKHNKKIHIQTWLWEQLILFIKGVCHLLLEKRHQFLDVSPIPGIDILGFLTALRSEAHSWASAPATALGTSGPPDSSIMGLPMQVTLCWFPFLLPAHIPAALSYFLPLLSSWEARTRHYQGTFTPTFPFGYQPHCASKALTPTLVLSGPLERGKALWLSCCHEIGSCTPLSQWQSPYHSPLLFTSVKFRLGRSFLGNKRLVWPCGFPSSHNGPYLVLFYSFKHVSWSLK